MVIVEVRGESYYMNQMLKDKWDKIKDGKLTKHDEDRCYIVDGRERLGKSCFTFQQAAYIDPTILDDENGKVLPRITFSPEETLAAIRNTKSTKDETKCIIFDEAFRGLSSKSALSLVNKQLVQAMMEMGQNNVVLFIVSPSFFLLEMYPAVLRSSALFHIKKVKGSNTRMWQCFNWKKKAMIYQIGLKKGWGYPIYTKFKDHFFNKYPGGKEFELRYRKKKWDSLKQEEVNKPMSSSRKKENKALFASIKAMAELGLTHKKIQEALEKHGYQVSMGWISEVKRKGTDAEYVE